MHKMPLDSYLLQLHFTLTSFGLNSITSKFEVSIWDIRYQEIVSSQWSNLQIHNNWLLNSFSKSTYNVLVYDFAASHNIGVDTGSSAKHVFRFLCIPWFMYNFSTPRMLKSLWSPLSVCFHWPSWRWGDLMLVWVQHLRTTLALPKGAYARDLLFLFFSLQNQNQNMWINMMW